ncbi:tetratricopeptide repeat protein [Thalassomonas sp. RHCl1]|uniref:tetratricopeptide repeat protein n=1 Tax=Thalassomonas sp. RHCl1 TaxID=2995320 RepID=UPI00248D0F76|nr:tetratricopeptide repeat protein [Thalassomonas sp. RHCl1]
MEEKQGNAVQVSKTSAFIFAMQDTLKKCLHLPSCDNYQWLWEKIKYTWQYAAKLLAVMAALLVLISSAKGIFQENYTIVPFEVPLVFSDSGINGNVVVWNLSDNISALQKSGWSVRGLHIQSDADNTIDKDIVLFGVSFNTVKSLIRHGLGISDKSISGSLVYQQDRLLLRLAVSGNDTIMIVKNINDFKDSYEAYEALMRTAAQELLSVIDPFVLASHFWAEKQTGKSLKIIKQMVKDNSSSADSAYLIWGKILAEQEDPQGAIAKFKASVEFNPDQYLAWTNWATMLYRNGKYQEAMKKCQKALSIEPQMWEAAYLWAKALSKVGRHKEAITLFQRAIDINAKEELAYNEISYEFQALGDIKSAIDLLLQGIRQVPNNGLLHATLAEMYWSDNDKKSAFESLTRATELGFDISPYIESEPYHSFHIKEESFVADSPQSSSLIINQ